MSYAKNISTFWQNCKVNSNSTTKFKAKIDDRGITFSFLHVGESSDIEEEQRDTIVYFVLKQYIHSYSPYILYMNVIFLIFIFNIVNVQINQKKM